MPKCRFCTLTLRADSLCSAEQCMWTMVMTRLSMPLRIISDRRLKFKSFTEERNSMNATCRWTEKPFASVSMIAREIVPVMFISEAVAESTLPCELVS